MVRSGDRSLLSNELGNLPARLPPQRKGGGTKTYLAKTTGSPTGGVYPVDLYKEKSSDPSDAVASGELEVLNLNIDETLDTGTWLVANPVQVTITGEG